MVHGFRRRRDREVAAFISSALSYGRVAHILKTLEQIFSPMGVSPYAFVRDFDLARDGAHFSPIVHRFNRGRDILCLLLGLQQIIGQDGSLRKFFLRGYAVRQPDTTAALSSFVDAFLALDFTPVLGKHPPPSHAGLSYLLPSPRKGSACKRLHMFLRWVVRRSDGVDLGLWEEVSPSKLIIPLDTHVVRISRRIGLTRRRAADAKAAREVTAALRCFEPEDPVKYDFALARLGILQRCTKERHPAVCAPCQLYAICRVNDT